MEKFGELFPPWAWTLNLKTEIPSGHGRAVPWNPKRAEVICFFPEIFRRARASTRDVQ